MAVCPWSNCKLYTVVYRITETGDVGDAIVGWPGTSYDCPSAPWWDSETPWSWFSTSFITTTSASNQTINNPSDWVQSGSKIEVIASGAGGCTGTGSSDGSGGGAYELASAVNLTPSASATFFCNVGSGSAQSPVAGPDAWYNGTTLAGSSCGAKGGKGGTGTSTGGGAGGSSASGVGTSGNSGGGGGASGTASGGGSGGAGGPAGIGGAGPVGTSTSGNSGSGGGGGGSAGSVCSASTGGNGGTNSTGGGAGPGTTTTSNGGAGTLGGGGGGSGPSSGPTGGQGGAGTDWDASHGSGGGGGGGTTNGGTGGLYGGAAGCGLSGSGAGGTGGQAIIVLTWTPGTAIGTNPTIISRPGVYRGRPGILGHRPILPAITRDFSSVAVQPTGQVIIGPVMSDHPLYKLLTPGIQGPNVRPPIIDRVAVPPQPTPIDHPGPQMRPSIQGPNVRPPVADYSIGRQEVPSHPGPSLAAGVQGPNVRPPTRDIVSIYQELPGHPLPQMRPSIQGPNVHAPTTDYSIGRQETPFHPGPALAPGIQGPNVRVPVRDIVQVYQQLPDQPPSQMRPSIQGPNVAAPPQVGYTISPFVQPDHPIPRSVLRMGTVGAANQDVPPPQGRYVLVRQELPSHPPSVLLPAPPPSSVLVVPFLCPQPILVRQEQPGHPGPNLSPGVQGPNVAASPQIGAVVLRQELPFHPSSVLQASVPSIMQPPGLVVTRQEQPPPIFPVVQSSVPNIRRLVADMVIVRQELPGHPAPTLLPSFIQPVLRSAVRDYTIGTQEQPRHTSSYTLPGIFINRPLSTNQPGPIIGRQEQPWHPVSFVLHHAYISTVPPPPPPPPAFTVGRLVFLQSDQPLRQGGVGMPRRVYLQADQPLRQGGVGMPRTVVLLPDYGVNNMQLPDLLSFGESGPMDNEPFTFDASLWIQTVVGDTLVSGAVTVTNYDGTPQQDISIAAQAADPVNSMVTVWLNGGVVGNNYLVTTRLVTTSGRIDNKSVSLQIVGSRS